VVYAAITLDCGCHPALLPKVVNNWRPLTTKPNQKQKNLALHSYSPESQTLQIFIRLHIAIEKFKYFKFAKKSTTGSQLTM
jgi:hypothetical protein